MENLTFKELLGNLLEAFEPQNMKMYRELSMMFHPDRGGDAEKMKSLNTARDNGDWNTIKRMYRDNVETEKEDEPEEIPTKSSLLFKLYKDWARQIEQDLAERGSHNIKIIIELQGSSANAWVHWYVNGERKQVHIPKIDRFKRKKDFSQEILKKFSQMK
jgi:hypothetical protein